MAQKCEVSSNHVVVLDIKDSDLNHSPPSSGPDNNNEHSCFFVTVPFMQKVIAEFGGTYMLILVGCAVKIVDLDKDNLVTFPGRAIVWGLLVMVLVYSFSHISGAHLNPAITIAFASSKRFPWKQVPAYISAQVAGSTLASGTLRLIFNGKQNQFAGTAPAPGASEVQSLLLEFIITFFLMIVVSSNATDDRAIRELAALVVGATITVNVFFAGSISGASMNPARSLGPAIVWNQYRGLWIYMVGPPCGAVLGALVYNFFRPPTTTTTDTPNKKSWCGCLCHRSSGSRISSV